MAKKKGTQEGTLLESGPVPEKATRTRSPEMAASAEYARACKALREAREQDARAAARHAETTALVTDCEANAKAAKDALLGLVDAE